MLKFPDCKKARKKRKKGVPDAQVRPLPRLLEVDDYTLEVDDYTDDYASVCLACLRFTE